MREVLKRENRCFQYTRRGTRQENSAKAEWLTCAHCNGRHFTTICDPDFRRHCNIDEGEASSSPVSEQAMVLKSSLGTGGNLMCTREQQFLLQTARACTEGQQERALVRLFLDGGSQRTFINRNLSEKLKLKVLWEEELKIFAFGDQSAIPRTITRRVELWLRSQYDGKGVRLEALEVPCICADIMATPSNSVLL
ncbi:uncharacterized protein [Dermacentor andersoni]|uniref:uncharacterized protein n=1 Tax=Dermacentor andersoni TaxID=34620 RepID=UPI003B3B4319